jgi:hypothetical protein
MTNASGTIGIASGTFNVKLTTGDYTGTFWDASRSWKVIDTANTSNSNFSFGSLTSTTSLGGQGSFATRLGTGADAGDVFLDWTPSGGNSVTLTSVGSASSPSVTINGSNASYVGAIYDVSPDAATGVLGINAAAAVSPTKPILVALDLEGYSNLATFIASLTAPTGYAMTATDISGSTPGWITSLGGGTDWEVLLSFTATGGSPFDFNWSFSGIQSGTTVDRIAVVPEPTAFGLIGVGAMGMLTGRRRRRSAR